MPLTREQHLRIARGRADEFAKAGDFGGAVQCFTGDLGKHESTKHFAMPNTYNAGRECKTADEVRKWMDDVIARANAE